MFCKFHDVDLTKVLIIPKCFLKHLGEVRTLLNVHQYWTLIRNNVAAKIILGLYWVFHGKLVKLTQCTKKFKKNLFL